MQPVNARLDTAKALNFPPADEIEPDACAVLEDTVPANEIQIVHTQVALRAALPGVPCKLHLSLNGHCSTPFGGEPPTHRNRSNLMGGNIHGRRVAVNLCMGCGKLGCYLRRLRPRSHRRRYTSPR